MKKIAYIKPSVIVKDVAGLSIMQGSLDPNNPVSGLDDDDDITPGGDDPGDFAKQQLTIDDVWED